MEGFNDFYALPAIIIFSQMQQRLSVQEYTRGVLSGDRLILSRAITVIESKLDDDRILAAEILKNILPATGNVIRIGISGVPGAGKSTFIESFGQHVINGGQKLAVLTIDPSSQRSGGSILGDKTRMPNLSQNLNAYIRPSASGQSLGGVAETTRETMLLCEAAGFDMIFVETVGVGQSETFVQRMTDFFVVLALTGAGDDLQGIKRGILEVADLIVINKADGDNLKAAKRLRAELETAVQLFPHPPSGLPISVLTASGRDGLGLAEIEVLIQKSISHTQQSGYFTRNRQAQNQAWLWAHISRRLEERFYENASVAAAIPAMKKLIDAGEILPGAAATELLNIFFGQKFNG